jgi:hypothetical protein
VAERASRLDLGLGSGSPSFAMVAVAKDNAAIVLLQVLLQVLYKE